MLKDKMKMFPIWGGQISKKEDWEDKIAKRRTLVHYEQGLNQEEHVKMGYLFIS